MKPIDSIQETDRHVGLRIRQRRMQLNISQEKLGEAVGVTFQQMQKYEKAKNRVSASRLHQIATVLGVPVAYFFEGLETASGGTDPEVASQAAVLATRSGGEAVRLWPAVVAAGAEAAVLNVMRAVAGRQAAA